MNPTIKDMINVGAALVASAVDKGEKLVSELVRSGKLSAEEGRKTLEEMKKRGEELNASIRQRVDSEVKAALQKMDLVLRKDLEELRSEFQALKERLQEGLGGKG